MIFIIRNIKRVCKHKMIIPAIVIAIAIASLAIIPFYSIFNPTKVDDILNINGKHSYVEVTGKNLQYTGYNVVTGTGGKYSFYYARKEEKCIFALIKTDGSPKAVIDEVTFKAKVMPAESNNTFNEMLKSYAKDLNWTEQGLNSITSPYMVSQADYHAVTYAILLGIILLIILIALIRLIFAIIWLINPHSYPVCKSIARKDRREIIEEAQEEIDSDNYLQINRTYITEDYFIDFGKSAVSVIPLSDVIWIYRIGKGNVISLLGKPEYALVVMLKNGKTIRIHHKTTDEALDTINAIHATEYDIIIGHSETKRDEAKERIVK